MAVRDVLLFGNPSLLQHEIDHLDGVLFSDRIERPETITMVEEWDPSNATP